MRYRLNGIDARAKAKEMEQLVIEKNPSTRAVTTENALSDYVVLRTAVNNHATRSQHPRTLRLKKTRRCGII